MRLSLSTCAAFVVALSLLCPAVLAMPALDPPVADIPETGTNSPGTVVHTSLQPDATRSPVAQRAPTLRAEIDLTSQRITVTDGGVQLHDWAISSGRTGHETPTGKFQPAWMAKQWYSRKYNMAPMPYAVFFNGGIATHGTTAVSRLGRPASHGCIRLETAHARTFFNLVRKHGIKNTRIVVTGYAEQSPYAVATAAVSAPRVRRSSIIAKQHSQTYGLPQSSFNMMTAER